MKLNIEKSSLKDKIVSSLMEKIIDGDIKVGEKLKEGHLANMFGVSQAPVREAIISLVSLGILEHKPNVGAKVKSFNKIETIEIYQAREALELYAIEHIENFDKLVSLKDTYNLMIKAIKENNIKLFVMHDKTFHTILMQMCENSLLLELWIQQYTKSSVYNLVKKFEFSLDQVVNIHLPIIEAVENSSTIGCKNSIHNHYQTIIKNIKETK